MITFSFSPSSLSDFPSIAALESTLVVSWNDAADINDSVLTAAFVIFCWWLMSKKKVSPVVTMLILVVVAFIGVMIGFFNPGLKY